MNSTLKDNDTDVGNIFGKPHKTILFNDNTHSMDEVVTQVIKAINCAASQAVEITMTAHSSGSAVVFTGSLERCEHVAAVLEQIALATSVEEA